MAKIIFYEKPGCINNTKQKALLQAAGHDLEVHNLLTEPWTVDRLRLFFGEQPVTNWFNRTAPQVKSGEVIPEALDAESALALMVQNPILVRRPLMQVDNHYSFGFDTDTIDTWIGLTPLDSTQQPTVDRLRQEDLQTCPQAAQQAQPCSTQ